MLLTKEKKTQPEYCELSFIWGKMNITLEAVFQIALRNFCGSRAEVSIYVILVKGGVVHAIKHIFSAEGCCTLVKATDSQEEQMSPWMILVLFYIWGDARIGLIKSSPKNGCLETCSAKFFIAQCTSFLTSTLNSFHGRWRLK